MFKDVLAIIVGIVAITVLCMEMAWDAIQVGSYGGAAMMMAILGICLTGAFGFLLIFFNKIIEGMKKEPKANSSGRKRISSTSRTV